MGHLTGAGLPNQIITLASDGHPNDLITSTASAEHASAPVWKTEPRLAGISEDVLSQF